jgi:hypothetical protein
VEQIPVIVARDRRGATTDAVLPKLDRASIAAALGGVMTSANTFCCDDGGAIVAFARRAGIVAHVLRGPASQTPNAPDFHFNNVNAYHGRLKEWLRRFHGVATPTKLLEKLRMKVVGAGRGHGRGYQPRERAELSVLVLFAVRSCSLAPDCGRMDSCAPSLWRGFTRPTVA